MKYEDNAPDGAAPAGADNAAHAMMGEAREQYTLTALHAAIPALSKVVTDHLGHEEYPETRAFVQVLDSALRVLASLTEPESHAHSAPEAEYANEQLALAARELVDATNALPADRRPVGWGPEPGTTAGGVTEELRTAAATLRTAQPYGPLDGPLARVLDAAAEMYGWSYGQCSPELRDRLEPNIRATVAAELTVAAVINGKTGGEHQR